MSEQAETGYRRIKEAGILVTLPGDLPLERGIMVADSLLAAPVQAVEVSFRGEQSLQLLADIEQRAGGLLVAGMSDVETAVQAEQAAAAGAAFISSPRLDRELRQACAGSQIGYIPAVISAWAVQAADRQGCPMVRLRTGGPQGGTFLQAMRELLPQMDFLLEVIDLSLQNVAAYAGGGAAALVTGRAVYDGDGQPMAEIISRARALQQAWQAAAGGGLQSPPPGKNGRTRR